MNFGSAALIWFHIAFVMLLGAATLCVHRRARKRELMRPNLGKVFIRQSQQCACDSRKRGAALLTRASSQSRHAAVIGAVFQFALPGAERKLRSPLQLVHRK
jgi:hypothetical protein